MGGFANLKTTFDNLLPHIMQTGEGKRPDPEQAFRYLQLRALFEIAGNLDSICLSQRAQVELIDKMKTGSLEIIAKAFEQFKADALRITDEKIAAALKDV